ncbi:MAG: DUF6526 family protein [Gemmatimonadota bacterium]
MADSTRPQSFENHARFVFGYHRAATFFLLVYLVWAMGRVFETPSWEHIAFASLGVAILLIGYYTRAFAAQNQDRIIRLEERLRLREHLPAELQPRIGEFTTKQLVALRFASDAELPTLARRVLDERITEQKAIKGLIEEWRPDHQRV